MGYIGNEPTTGHFPVDNFTSSGGSTYTLSRTPASAGAIEVSVQGVLQPTTAYTVSGTTLNMAGVTTGVKIFVRHLGETLSLPTPADGSVTTAKLGVNSVTTGKIAAGAVELADMQSGTAGDTLYYNPAPTRLAKGTAAQVLTMNAGATAPEWATAAAGGFSPGCRVWRTGDQSISNASFTKVGYNAENSSGSVNWDTDGDFDTTNNRFVVGTGDAGIYLATANIYWQNPNNGSVVRCNIRVSGNANTQTYHDANDALTKTTTCTALFNLTVGQYLEVYTYQNTGTTETIVGDERATFFCVQRIA